MNPYISAPKNLLYFSLFSPLNIFMDTFTFSMFLILACSVSDFHPVFAFFRRVLLLICALPRRSSPRRLLSESVPLQILHFPAVSGILPVWD